MLVLIDITVRNGDDLNLYSLSMGTSSNVSPKYIFYNYCIQANQTNEVTTYKEL
jgi:hypothetical protein